MIFGGKRKLSLADLTFRTLHKYLFNICLKRFWIDQMSEQLAVDFWLHWPFHHWRGHHLVDSSFSFLHLEMRKVSISKIEKGGESEGGGAVSSRSFDLLNSMIYWSRWSACWFKMDDWISMLYLFLDDLVTIATLGWSWSTTLWRRCLMRSPKTRK